MRVASIWSVWTRLPGLVSLSIQYLHTCLQETSLNSANVAKLVSRVRLLTTQPFFLWFRYYVLIAACVFLRKQQWLKEACLAAALLFPAVAALHGIVLAAVHVDGESPIFTNPLQSVCLTYELRCR